MCHPQIARFVLLFFLLQATSCETGPSRQFKKIVSNVSRYFAEKPTLVNFVPPTENTGTSSYYAIKIADHHLDHGTKRTGSPVSPYTSFIRISCSVLDNANSGDVERTYGDYIQESDSESLLQQREGFTTAEMALRNTDFLNPSKIVFLIKYAYKNSLWVFDSLHISYASPSLKRALRDFPQNSDFRRIVLIPD
jgi:hypothetical protein